jgi:thiol:disulfide interchange protein
MTQCRRRPSLSKTAGHRPYNREMRKRLLIAGLAAVSLAPAWAFQQLPEKFEPGRDAAADVWQALTLAQAQGKRVFVDVGGEWCSWCHIFDRFVASHPEVRKLLAERYVLVKVNYSPQQRNEQLLSRFPKAKGYPHFYVLDPGGRVLASQASTELEAGNDYDATKVLAFLRRHEADFAQK